VRDVRCDAGAAAGVDRLFLVKAAKVEKHYFGSHLMRQPEVLRAKLVEGLTQVGATASATSSHLQLDTWWHARSLYTHMRASETR
jgi:hypothetical protein